MSQTAWDAMAAAGRRFTFIKASDGVAGPDDAAMAANVTRAGNAGLLTGVYHVPRPERDPTIAGAIAEADHFIGYAGDAIGPGHLRPVLDLDANAASLTTAELTNW